MSFAHTFLHRFVEILGKERCATIEECSKGCDKCTDETDGNKPFDSYRKNIFHHHTRDKEHKNRKKFEITCSNSTTTCAFHHCCIIFSTSLTEYTLNDMLVSTPVP